MKEILTNDIDVLFDGLSKVKTMLNVSIIAAKDIPQKVKLKITDPVVYGLLKQAGVSGSLKTKIEFNEEDTFYFVFCDRRSSELKFMKFQVKKRKRK